MTETLEQVRAAAPTIKADAAAAEAAGRLTEATVGALRAAGVYRMTHSRSRGGPELSVPEQIDVIEEVSAADGAAGWCAMINSDGGYMTAFLAPEVAAKMYPTLDEPTAAVANPTGTAVLQGDHYVVNGQWPFASGAPQCEWFFLNTLALDEAGNIQPGPEGMPAMRMMAVPRAEVEILDTWYPTGLAGTASTDVRVAGAQVPAERTFSVFDDDAADPSPLYRYRFTFIVNLAAVPLGIARAAVDLAREVAPSKLTFPTMTPASQDPTLQWNLGRAAALVGSARAYLHDTAGTFWDAVCAGREPTAEEWRDVRLAMLHAAHAGKEAATLIYEGLGTTGVYRKSALDRHVRDLTTLTQHVLCQGKVYAAGGRSLLGLPTDAIAF